MNINSADHNWYTSPQLSPEDLQCIYELYLLYMQLHHTDEANDANDSTKMR